jgi:surface protein
MNPIYTISPALPPGLSINASNGIISGIPNTYQPVRNYAVTVSYTSNTGVTETATDTISIAVAASIPNLTLTFPTYSITAEVNKAYTAVVATSTGTGTPVYSISPSLPAGLSFNTATATISGTPTIASLAKVYDITVSYSNGSVTGQISIGVKNPTLYITATNSSLSFVKGTAITPVVLGTVVGTSSPYTYSLSPELPAGLTFNTATATISGTPTVTSGASIYTLMVTDTYGTTATVDITLSVIYPPINVTVNKTEYILFKLINVATSYPITATGGTGTLSYSISPALPAGLTFTASNCSFSGSPTAYSASTEYTITVTDSVGTTATGKFTIEVKAFDLVGLNPEITIKYDETVSEIYPAYGVGGVAPYTYTCSTLPSGFTFDTTTSSISGSQVGTKTLASYNKVHTAAYNGDTLVIGQFYGGGTRTILNPGTPTESIATVKFNIPHGQTIGALAAIGYDGVNFWHYSVTSPYTYYYRSTDGITWDFDRRESGSNITMGSIYTASTTITPTTYKLIRKIVVNGKTMVAGSIAYGNGVYLVCAFTESDLTSASKSYLTDINGGIISGFPNNGALVSSGYNSGPKQVIFINGKFIVYTYDGAYETANGLSFTKLSNVNRMDANPYRTMITDDKIIIGDYIGQYMNSSSNWITLYQHKASSKTSHTMTIKDAEGTTKSFDFTIELSQGSSNWLPLPNNIPSAPIKSTSTVSPILPSTSTAYMVKVTVPPTNKVVNVALSTKTASTISVIDWGDGTTSTVSTVADTTTVGTFFTVINSPTVTSHTYTTAGAYTISVTSGTGYIWCCVGSVISSGVGAFTNDATLTDVTQWGNQKWHRMDCMFRNCTGISSFSATDNPDLSQCVSMEATFDYATSFNSDITGWKTGAVTSMLSMFNNATSFNRDLSKWNVSKIPTAPKNFKFNPCFAVDATLFTTAKYPKWGTTGA